MTCCDFLLTVPGWFYFYYKVILGLLIYLYGPVNFALYLKTSSLK